MRSGLEGDKPVIADTGGRAPPLAWPSRNPSDTQCPSGLNSRWSLTSEVPGADHRAVLFMWVRVQHVRLEGCSWRSHAERTEGTVWVRLEPQAHALQGRTPPACLRRRTGAGVLRVCRAGPAATQRTQAQDAIHHSGAQRRARSPPRQ